VINISNIGNSNSVINIVNFMSNVGIKPNIEMIKNNYDDSTYMKNSIEVDSAISDIGIDKENYTKNLIKKYLIYK